MIELILAYLSSQQTVTFGMVKHAWDLEGIPTHEPAELPAALCYIDHEHAGDDGTDKKVSDKLTVRFKVHLVVKTTDLTVLKAGLRGLLVGWNPDQPAGWDDVRFLGGRMVSLGVGLVRWEEEYYTWRIQRSVF